MGREISSFSKENKNWSISKLKKFLYDGDLRTDSVIVYKDGNILLEKYNKDRGYSKNTKHLMWSVSKSFTNAIIGLAVKEGRISINDSVCKWYKDLKNKDKCDITVNHLLTYTAGLKWSENYSSNDVTTSDVLQMLYGKGTFDGASFALKEKPLLYKPGEVAQYNTGVVNILMGIIKKTYGQNGQDKLISRFFKYLNVKSIKYKWMKDESGSFIGGSHLYTTSRVMLKFGKLYLNDGVVKYKRKTNTPRRYLVQKRRILPRGWVKYSRTLVSEKVIDHGGLEPNLIESLGGLFWLNKPVKGETPWPDLPLDTYMAIGHWGQYVIIIPSQKLIIIRTGLDKLVKFDRNQFVKLVMDYIK